MKTILLVLASVTLVALGVTLGACDSSSDTGAGAGPHNPPATTDNDAGSSGADGGTTTDGGSSSGACTGPTFDNSRIPGWPTVPTP
jgi:hypothetical protein